MYKGYVYIMDYSNVLACDAFWNKCYLDKKGMIDISNISQQGSNQKFQKNINCQIRLCT